MIPTPTDKGNFIIEVTPEQYDELKSAYRYSDQEPIVNMLYSPYWKDQAELTSKEEK